MARSRFTGLFYGNSGLFGGNIGIFGGNISIFGGKYRLLAISRHVFARQMSIHV